MQSKGSIHSPNFPNKFPMNMQCAWVLTTLQPNNVILNFNDFMVCKIQNDNDKISIYVMLLLFSWANTKGITLLK